MQVCSSTQSVEVGVAGGNEIGERSDWCKKQVYANLDADAANKEVRRYMEGQQLYSESLGARTSTCKNTRLEASRHQAAKNFLA